MGLGLVVEGQRKEICGEARFDESFEGYSNEMLQEMFGGLKGNEIGAAPGWRSMSGGDFPLKVRSFGGKRNDSIRKPTHFSSIRAVFRARVDMCSRSTVEPRRERK